MTEATVREQRAAMYGIRSNDERDVPLHLLPLLILQFVRQTGTRIYRISVKRTRWRAYNVSVRTRSKHREREPEPAVMVPPGPVVESTGKESIDPHHGKDLTRGINLSGIAVDRFRTIVPGVRDLPGIPLVRGIENRRRLPARAAGGGAR